MGSDGMNLADILLPKTQNNRPPATDCADCAESQQQQGLQSPQAVAESCGKALALAVIRNNPQAVAESAGSAALAFPHNPQNPQARTAEIEKPLPLTREYFASQGVDLLRDDLAFLFQRLPKGTTARNKAIATYIETWRTEMCSEPLSHKQANRGRFAANSWLRECKI